jgi:hypothetical protein
MLISIDVVQHIQIEVNVVVEHTLTICFPSAVNMYII